ncbi:hypothetical protein HPB51_017381 [Rhipicephalus microplus]|uniref:Uncharacterized protein n=1 Tax=Rhipicephalus microplus TaxID=6941 RepID=A0A9J6DVJ2_RHIMP|nr:hypothetical protein HPB51_017381 [Rhipicephalus microplus]
MMNGREAKREKPRGKGREGRSARGDAILDESTQRRRQGMIEAAWVLPQDCNASRAARIPTSASHHLCAPVLQPIKAAWVLPHDCNASRAAQGSLHTGKAQAARASGSSKTTPTSSVPPTALPDEDLAALCRERMRENPGFAALVGQGIPSADASVPDGNGNGGTSADFLVSFDEDFI